MEKAHQFGDCMHVDKAAPIPVPVQIRIPRLYNFDVFETPANYSGMKQWCRKRSRA